MRIMINKAIRLVCLGLVFLAQSAQAQDNPIAFDLVPIRESIQKANQLLQDGKIVDCVALIERSTVEIQELSKRAPVNAMSDVKKIHAELAKSHQLLAVQGAELNELPSWDSLLKLKKSIGTKKLETKNAIALGTESSAISFSKDIAPWLVEQCARCHINAERGGLSLATFKSIVKGSKGGIILFPGDPIGSRLVETVETGDMPRSGNKVSPENLAKLKQWVKEGAKFDGLSPDVPIVSLTVAKPTSQTPTVAPVTPKISEPTGTESVSFARDIAPVLIANCNGCHYNATRISGGLQFNMYSQIVKGGVSGPVVLLGKPDESLIIRKLRGLEGARMPLGREPLSESQIQLFATWIKEGATFDGLNKDSKLDQVVSQAFVSSASHSEIMAKRVERSRERWKIAFPKVEPNEAMDDNFHVIGNIGEESAKNLIAQANAVSTQIRRILKLPTKEPLIKGGVTIFALKLRNDYSEFGKMLENRNLPAEWSSHWRKEVLDSYVAIVVDKAESKINETSLLQQLTSLWVGTQEGVPRWFAEGAGRQALALSVGANDLRVQPWLKRIPDAISQMKNLKTLADGTMNDEALATIGFGVIRTMYDAKMKPQYELILRSLASGMNFDQATSKSIGSMDLFLQKLLGKGK